MIYDEVLKINRRLRLEALKLSMDIQMDPTLVQFIIQYLEEYSNYHKLSAGDISASYDQFAIRYRADLHRFYETGKYPAQLDETLVAISRTDYDIALILSVLLNAPRHEIFRNFMTTVSGLKHKRLLFIGIGAAIELFIVKQLRLGVEVDAYDISINPFAMEFFADFNLQEKLYTAPVNPYDCIFAIELLEHLEDPMELTGLCYRSLVKDGRFVATTATNMPQFDHLYNFTDDSYLNSARELGFQVIEKKEFLQPYSREIISGNGWLIFKKS